MNQVFVDRQRVMDRKKKNAYKETLPMDLLASLPRVKTVKRGQVKANLERLQKKFNEVSDENGNVHLEQFKMIMNCKNDLFLDRLFAIFDKDSSGEISKKEFLQTINEVILKPDDQKIEFLFQMYDFNGDQSISKDELKSVLKACMAENKLYFSDSQIERLAMVLIEDADIDNDDSISWIEFKNLIEKQPGLTTNLAISIDRWLLPFEQDESENHSRLRNYFESTFIYRKLNREYIKNNVTSVIFFCTWLLINILLTIERIHLYYFTLETNVSVTVARCCGQCLNFNCSFILLLMIRKTITLLRTLNLSEYLPLDQHIYYHKLVGWAILVFSIVHTFGHGCNVFRFSQQSGVSFFSCFFGTEMAIGWFGSAFITGWVLIIILFAITISSMNFVRRKDHFEVFYYFHLLYVPFFLVCLLHAPNYWKWLLFPGIIFLIEKYLRLRTISLPSVIREARILPSEVINLVIEKPPHFHHNAGDFIFIQIPEIAKREWHPFTISSAPEHDEDTLWLHIRVCGQWTRKLYQKYVQFENIKVIDSTSIWGSDYRTAAFGKDNLGFNEITFEVDETNDEKSKKQTSTMVHFNNNVTYLKEVDENDNEHVEHAGPLERTTTNNKESVCANLGVHTPAIVQHPYNSTPLYSFSTNETTENDLNKLRQNFRPPKLERTSPIQRSISNVSNSMQLCKLNKGKACRLFNECDQDCSEQDQEQPIRQFNKTVRYPMRAILDGPYGSPSSDIFNAEHAVLIAPGIGVTPFASILQAIMLRYQESKHYCPKCSFKFSDAIPKSLMKLKKVDFVWINREQRCFEWFLNLMAQLEITQQELGDSERFLDMHVYVTSAKDKSDMKAIGLQLALDLLHEKSKRDLITGLKTRTQPGRPNWDKFFSEIKKQKKGKVTVFYCGNPEMGRILQQFANKYEFCFKKENF